MTCCSARASTEDTFCAGSLPTSSLNTEHGWLDLPELHTQDCAAASGWLGPAAAAARHTFVPLLIIIILALALLGVVALAHIRPVHAQRRAACTRKSIHESVEARAQPVPRLVNCPPKAAAGHQQQPPLVNWLPTRWARLGHLQQSSGIAPVHSPRGTAPTTASWRAPDSCMLFTIARRVSSSPPSYSSRKNLRRPCGRGGAGADV